LELKGEVKVIDDLEEINIEKDMINKSKIIQEMVDGVRCILCGGKPTESNTLNNQGICYRCWRDGNF